MAKRALFILDWQRFSDQHLSFIETQAPGYDELLFVIHRADEELQPLVCGRLMQQLQERLSARLTKPYYLFPVTGKGVPHLSYWIRYKLLCPSFEKVYIDTPWLKETLTAILEVPVEVLSAGESAMPVRLQEATPKRRGLFITRAQPFHLGHADFVRQMMEEQEEGIVLVAMANRSHLLTDLATAGERMEMILPWLTAAYPGRFYLAPFAYSDYTMENLYELRHLLPSFQCIYTINPLIEAMAETAGYETRTFKGQLDISATMIREKIVKDEPYQAYVPDSVYQYLSQSPLPQRLKKLHEKEIR